MRILLVTGKSAEEKIRSIAGEFGCEVLAVPVGAASFLTPRLIANSLKKIKKKKFDLIVVPGAVNGDLKVIQGSIGARIVRSSSIGDLEKMLVRASLLKKLEKPAESSSKKHVMVGGLPVGRDFPIRILAEIVNAGNLSREEILKRANYFKASGADIIDLGFNEKNPDRFERAVNLLMDLNIPLSVDTMEKENIARAIELGIDLILSFDGELLKEFRDVEIPSVIIPGRGAIPAKPDKRVRILSENIKLAERRGFEKIIADPILQPINFGFVDSIIAYREFGRLYSYPMLMGTGNVTELFDAHPTGMNALMCAIAAECGASIVLTPEHSRKMKGSVRELSIGAKMMYASMKRKCFPKDLGIDLLDL